MKYYLAKFHRDWADEFYANGFSIMDEVKYLDLKKLVDDHAKDDISFYFGTNEGWDTTVENIYSDISFKEITEEQANDLKALFDLTENWPFFGFFPDIQEIIEENEEWDEIE